MVSIDENVKFPLNIRYFSFEEKYDHSQISGLRRINLFILKPKSSENRSSLGISQEVYRPCHPNCIFHDWNTLKKKFKSAEFRVFELQFQSLILTEKSENFGLEWKPLQKFLPPNFITVSSMSKLGTGNRNTTYILIINRI
jgi:hypothetical protein